MIINITTKLEGTETPTVTEKVNKPKMADPDTDYSLFIRAASFQLSLATLTFKHPSFLLPPFSHVLFLSPYLPVSILQNPYLLRLLPVLPSEPFTYQFML
ncbi:hypothetical protein AMECASPLE_037314 [Ameca splendens]|uniref:Uncharacterized protein n=1 Tax=Ameca splendens TaxID=208324 RepID=A0ABV0ZGM1_9TELE